MMGVRCGIGHSNRQAMGDVHLLMQPRHSTGVSDHGFSISVGTRTGFGFFSSNLDKSVSSRLNINSTGTRGTQVLIQERSPSKYELGICPFGSFWRATSTHPTSRACQRTKQGDESLGTRLPVDPVTGRADERVIFVVLLLLPRLRGRDRG
jgi:hypothetical protein